MTDKPHKIMTPEEYAAMNIIGWHRVCKDVDGFGGVGVQFQSPCVTEALEACASVWAHLADTNDPDLRKLADECRAAIAPAMR